MIMLDFVDKLNFKIEIDEMNAIIVLKILLFIYKVSPNSLEKWKNIRFCYDAKQKNTLSIYQFVKEKNEKKS